MAAKHSRQSVPKVTAQSTPQPVTILTANSVVISIKSVQEPRTGRDVIT